MHNAAQEQQIVRFAAIVSIGNVMSRAMGLVREMVIAGVFGASGAMSAYRAARQVPFTLYDMLIGGMITSALVPTFSEYTTQERRDELWHVASLLLTLTASGLGIMVLILELGAPLLTRALVQFGSSSLQALTTDLLRIVILGVFFLGLSGIITALCHALQRFTLPAFAAAVFNATIVVFALTLGPRWIKDVRNPTIDDIWVGDVIAGQVATQENGTLLAETLVVDPTDLARYGVQGEVRAVEGQTLTITGERGDLQVRVDQGTSIRIRRRQVHALAIGLVLGAALQVALQFPALRDMRFRLAFDLRHPVLRHILGLYLPVVLSLVVAGLGVLVDRNLASRTGELTISWMSFATTLREFPLGLVSLAVSTAILPALAAQATLDHQRKQPSRPKLARRMPVAGAGGDFCATLASGLRLVLVLTLPAAVGLLVLARPLVALLFQHGVFGATDTIQTALALRYYLIGMVFAAIDLPLVFAFYARKDTLRPALVGILGVVLYLLVALPTYRTLGMIGLILANDAQLAGHAAVMIWLFQRQVGTLRGYGVGQTLLKSVAASAVMGLVVYGIALGVRGIWPAGGRTSWALTVVVGGGIGLGVYLGLCALLRVRELELARTLLFKISARLRT